MERDYEYPISKNNQWKCYRRDRNRDTLYMTCLPTVKNVGCQFSSVDWMWIFSKVIPHENGWEGMRRARYMIFIANMNIVHKYASCYGNGIWRGNDCFKTKPQPRMPLPPEVYKCLSLLVCGIGSKLVSQFQQILTHYFLRNFVLCL